MRIALLIGSLGLGGAERQCVELAKVLQARGHTVHVIYFNDKHAQLRSEVQRAGLQLTLLKAHCSGDPSVILRLATFLRRKDIQIAHSFLFTAGYYSRTAAYLAGVPVVVHGERNGNPHQRKRQLFVDRLLARITSHFVANSYTGASLLASFIGVGHKKIKVIFNGIDLSRFQLASHDAPTPVIISVGRLWPQKNYETALDAVARCAAEMKVAYKVAGDSNSSLKHLQKYRERLIERSQKDDLRDIIEWLGYRLDVPDLLSSANIFLSTSRHEGMPNAVLEAMAAGLPVVVSNVSDNADIVRDGIDGFIVEDPNDGVAFARCLATLLRDASLRRKMGAAARERIEDKFSAEVLGDAHEALYTSLLNQNLELKSSSRGTFSED